MFNKKVFWEKKGKTMRIVNLPELVKEVLGKEISDYDCVASYTDLIGQNQKEHRFEWHVAIEDKEYFGYVGTANDALDEILHTLKQFCGLNLYEDHHYIISRLETYWSDNRHRVVQRKKNLNDLVPDVTWFIVNGTNRIYVYVEEQKEPDVFDKPKSFDIDKWIVNYLSTLNINMGERLCPKCKTYDLTRGLDDLRKWNCLRCGEEYDEDRLFELYDKE